MAFGKRQKRQPQVCVYHPGLPATAKCEACDKPLCDDCAYERDEAIFCGTMCADEFGSARAERRHSRSSQFGRLIGWLTRSAVRLVLVLLLLALVAAVLALPFSLEYAAGVAAQERFRERPWAGNMMYRAGKINTRVGRYEAAMPILRQAAELFPEHEQLGDAVYQFALCLEKTGDTDRARKTYEKFVGRFPDHRWTDQAERKLEAWAVGE